jgi:hypothetical protein
LLTTSSASVALPVSRCLNVYRQRDVDKEKVALEA